MQHWNWTRNKKSVTIVWEVYAVLIEPLAMHWMWLEAVRFRVVHLSVYMSTAGRSHFPTSLPFDIGEVKANSFCCLYFNICSACGDVVLLVLIIGNNKKSHFVVGNSVFVVIVKSIIVVCTYWW